MQQRWPGLETWNDMACQNETTLVLNFLRRADYYLILVNGRFHNHQN